MVYSYEPFCRRITGNYSLMQAQITGEELLHIVTRPSDIYLMEGGGDILSQTTIYNKKEDNLEILNQFLNRIIVENDMPLTYQDRVYISSILRKLGITDVQQFMTQVSQIKEEAVNTEQLVSLYWQHMEELQELVSQYQQENRTEHTELSSRSEANELYLHEEIMNRLQTGLLYQILQNFGMRQGDRISDFSNYELRMSEHYRMTKNILLNKLENTVRNESMPLTYYHENFYEEFPYLEELTEEKVANHVTAAALLQLIDNVYEQRIAKRLYGTDVWMHLENSLNQTTENMLSRLTNEEWISREQTIQAGARITDLNQSFRQEIQMIHSLFEENDIDTEEGDSFFSYQETPERISHTRTEEREQLIREERSPEERAMDAATLEFWQEGDSENVLNEENIELLSQRLEEINRNNLENRNTYLRFLENIRAGQERREPSGKGAERMKEESLLALQNPQELLHRYQEEAEADTEERVAGVTRAMEMLPQDSRRIYHILDQYLQYRAQSGMGKMPGRNDMGMLMQDAEFIRRSKEQSRQELIHPEPEEERDRAADAAVKTLRDQIYTENNQTIVRQTKLAAADRLSLVHKIESENQIDETVLEELLQRGRTETKVTEVSENTVQRTQKNIQNVQTQMNTQTVTDTAAIAEMIQRGVRRQMGEISEQVYSRIEKKLQNERKRRGI